MLVQTSEGSSAPLQPCKDGKTTADVTASSVSEGAPAPQASTYKSLSCNERVAQMDYIRLLTGSPASCNRLQVPQNVITQKTLQVTPSARPSSCMFLNLFSAGSMDTDVKAMNVPSSCSEAAERPSMTT